MKENDPEQQAICLHVQRGCGNGPSSIDMYSVPAGTAMSLLDCLQWVRQNVDGSLAFRYACINANACKECMMHLDGKAVYACLARPQPGMTHLVEPLPNKPRLRDLIAEIGPAKEQLLLGAQPEPDEGSG